MSKATQYYTPGVCNINNVESASRKKIAYVFFVLALLFILLSILFALSFYSIIITFPLMFIASLNYLQAKNNFCVMYAKNNLFNSSEAFADTEKITDEHAIRADSQKSQRMYLHSAGFAFLLSLAHLLILLSR